MEPLKPHDKTKILQDNPAADAADIAEYERLLAQRFTRDTSVPAPVADAAADPVQDVKARLRELYNKLYPNRP